MTSKNLWTRLWIMPLMLSLASVGCAKKTPEPTPAPPVAQAPTPTPPPPAPAPTDTTTTPALIGSGDFQPAFFDLDSYTLRDDARAALDRDAKLLRDNPTVNVTIEGHCDERGTAEYNLALGERRAVASRTYLVSLGLDPNRLRTVSYGSEFPFDPAHQESAWSRNRRAHFVITAK